MYPSARFSYHLSALLLLLLASCKTSYISVSREDFLEQVLRKHPEDFAMPTAQKQERRVQIIYSRIDRDKRNRPHFTDYYYNVDTGIYFYPASTVKMPIAFLAMEKLYELQQQGVPIDRNSTLITEKASPKQTAVYNDPTTPDGRPTLAHYVKKLFVVSDNDASNRLYEWLGQEYLHRRLAAKGFPSAQILHRLSVSLPDEENRHTNPVAFYDTAGQFLYQQPPQMSKLQYIPRNDKVGKGYMRNGVLVNEPMDFSTKNRIYLTDLHQMLRAFLFPEIVPPHQRFRMGDDDRRYVLQMMSQLPRETVYPDYQDGEHYDGYVKFFLFGTQKTQNIPPHIRIFNKVGWAYGFLTDVAYVVDFANNIEFMLSATIYCNSDEVLNDDKYEFESVGLPFLEKLGQAIYAKELKRKRRYVPDLSAFRLTYDR